MHLLTPQAMAQEKDEDQQQQPVRKKQDVSENFCTTKPVKGRTSSQTRATSPTAGGSGSITNIRTGKGTEESSQKKS
ncbi:hypothetical protein [Pontibacter anaerobius]|uniref:Uncharacterized protein n=1 Tax=Pontibacter anaerobius TaxID=2993940 RepID=A0ABT3R9K2_9BACT|nr:hypothetical protein [Pontibacter anaerobius]MCX2738464.1 hypothetical protein [Pontibacter anaerobius]